ADRFAHLHNLLRKRGELPVAGQLSAHLLHFPGRKLTASGATASNRPGPQIAGTVPGVTGPGAGTVRLAAAPVVLAETAPPEIPDSSQPLNQAGTPGLQLRQQRTGHSASNLIVLVTTRLRRDQPQLRSSTSVSHTRPRLSSAVVAPDLARDMRSPQWRSSF